MAQHDGSPLQPTEASYYMPAVKNYSTSSKIPVRTQRKRLKAAESTSSSQAISTEAFANVHLPAETIPNQKQTSGSAKVSVRKKRIVTIMSLSKTVLKVGEKSTDACPPLKCALGGANELIRLHDVRLIPFCPIVHFRAKLTIL